MVCAETESSPGWAWLVQTISLTISPTLILSLTQSLTLSLTLSLSFTRSIQRREYRTVPLAGAHRSGYCGESLSVHHAAIGAVSFRDEKTVGALLTFIHSFNFEVCYPSKYQCASLIDDPDDPDDPDEPDEPDDRGSTHGRQGLTFKLPVPPISPPLTVASFPLA